MRRNRPPECRYKRRFRDQQHALSTIRNFQKFSTRDEIPNRCYRCGHCKGYHITKTERRDRQVLDEAAQ